MLIQIKADRARTVDFLAVFAEGETKTFNVDEIKAFQAGVGVPFVSAMPEGFEVVFIGENDEERKLVAEGETK
jgi:hypothetical protein